MAQVQLGSISDVQNATKFIPLAIGLSFANLWVL